MKTYDIILKNAKTRGYLLSGWVIIFLNALIQLYIAISQEGGGKRAAAIINLAIVALMLLIGRGDKFNFRDRDHSISIAYATTMVVWLMWKLYVPFALLAVVYALYIIATRKLWISVTKKKIVYYTVPRKNITWEELSNIMVKDGLLTIDFKNNKLLQNETEGDDYFNEKEFNEFCRQQLTQPQSVPI